MKKQAAYAKELSLNTRASTFLHQYYLNRKASSKTWSFENWSRKLNTKKTTLLKTVHGQIGVSAKLEVAICAYFEFNENEKKYFKLLVINEKIMRQFPGTSINLPDLNSFKIKNFDLRKPEALTPELIKFISLPEVQWLLTCFGSRGLSEVDVQKIKLAFHAGIKANWVQLIETALKAGLLRKENSRIFFVQDHGIFLDGKSDEVPIAARRYLSLLKHLENMILQDHENGNSPALNNRAFCTLIDSACFPQILSRLDDFLKETMALFATEKGDLVVDAQIFLSPIANIRA